MVYGDWKESYNLLPRVVHAIGHYNPATRWYTYTGGRTVTDKSGKTAHVLQRVFWCFGQCVAAFQYCRPVLLVDGTFLIGKYKGVLMMAQAVDPEDQLVPMAFAIVEAENNDSWQWFMHLLRVEVMGKERKICVISDRHAGILKACKQSYRGYPPLEHRWCVRHFTTNLWRHQKDDEVVNKLKVLCGAQDERDFDKLYAELKKMLTKEGKRWMKKQMEKKKHWALAFDEGGARYGIKTTNGAESMNNVFKGIRALPVAGIAMYSFAKCNSYFVDRWGKAKLAFDNGARFGAPMAAHLRNEEKLSVMQIGDAYGPDRNLYCVRTAHGSGPGGERFGGRNYKVQIEEGICQCNFPQLYHAPCSHLITACQDRGLNHKSSKYMSPYYDKENTLKIWEPMFQPYLDPSQWPPYDGHDYCPDPDLLRVKVGRRKKKRLRGDMDKCNGWGKDKYGTGDFNELPGKVRMADPRFPLLEVAYEKDHRAPAIESGQVMPVLRMRTHTHVLLWDERYAPYLRQAGFLDLARVVNAGLPPLDPPLLTSLIDRWRPETHTFHLSCGEMTLTLQDAAMILGLPIEGQAVVHVVNANWAHYVELMLGLPLLSAILETVARKKTRTAGVTTRWLRDHFQVCPPDADEVAVERHARAWLWYLVACFLLPDGSGNTVTSLVLPILSQPWGNIGTYS
ncbi:hypothetical protein U9M48_002202 [Paspalum notatum var. saurae]|uniref:SWIM-type domain-containing protein n=1 Tax=Paspalum notatum var. saurae TaxID=547442 RepID=A0AAQ3PFR1_PASNO